mmetsp:Transcript_33111/g.43614  ORF Transcript_33111/g.43614 Transcript_33111/m.43614 type:complete len:107 (+) Transcript_33111:605-925(+)
MRWTRPHNAVALTATKKMVRFSLQTIDDLPEKLSYLELTRKVLSSKDAEYGGFKNLLEDFYEEIRRELAQVLSDAEDETLQDDFVSLISDYILRKLHSTVWSKECL